MFNSEDVPPQQKLIIMQSMVNKAAHIVTVNVQSKTQAEFMVSFEQLIDSLIYYILKNTNASSA